MNGAQTVPEIVQWCARGMVPVNVDVAAAISAHQQEPTACALFAVILARQPAVTDCQRQLDYLTTLPDKAWRNVPNWEQHREATLACLRRSRLDVDMRLIRALVLRYRLRAARYAILLARRLALIGSSMLF